MESITTPTGTVTPPENAIVHTVSAHLDGDSPAETVRLTQYDRTLPVIAVGLCCGGAPYGVPEGAAVNVRLQKPDRTCVYAPAMGLSEDRQTAYITVTHQMTAVQGEFPAILEIVCGDGVVGTAPIGLAVRQNPVSETAVISSDEFRALEDYVEAARTSAADAAASAEHIKDAEENTARSAAEAEASNQAAQSARQETEAARDRAETAAARATAARSIAEAARDAALLARAETESLRDAVQAVGNDVAQTARQVAEQTELVQSAVQQVSGKTAEALQYAQTAEAAKETALAARQTVENIRGELEEALAQAGTVVDAVQAHETAISAMEKNKLDGAFVDEGYLYLTVDDVITVGPLGPICGEGTPKYVVNYLDWDGTLLYQALVPQGGNAVDPVTAGYISAPEREATADTKYTFLNFGTLPTVSANTTLTAQYQVSYRVTFMNGSVVYDTAWVNSGGNASALSRTPTKSYSPQYQYTFAGWSLTPDSDTADADALRNITAPRTVYAAYTATIRTYAVKFYNGTALLYTAENIPYGGSTEYVGDTPEKTGVEDPDRYKFEGWGPLPQNITDATSCYAQYSTIFEDWSEIIAACADGSYSEKYSVGDTKVYYVGNTAYTAQIAAFDQESLTDGSKAPITWMTKLDNGPMNPALAQGDGFYVESTGTIGGWEKSEGRAHLQVALFSALDPALRDGIRTVTKQQYAYDTAGQQFLQTTEDTLFLPSAKEIFGNGGEPGSRYGVFATVEEIRKYSDFWTRTAYSASDFNYAYTSPSYGPEQHTDSSQTKAFRAFFCT